MTPPPPNSPSSSNLFPETRWSLVLRTRDQSQRDSALAELCQLYWFPLFVYVRKRGFSAPDAEDLTQGLFAKLFANHAIDEQLVPHKGRLRSWFLRSMSNFMISEWRKQTSEMRGGGEYVFSIEAEAAEKRFANLPVSNESPEESYDQQWALEILHLAFRRLREEYVLGGKKNHYEQLKRVLDAEPGQIRFEQLGKELGVGESHARVLAFRFRKHFRTLLMEELASSIGSDQDLEAELMEFRRILSGELAIRPSSL